MTSLPAFSYDSGRVTLTFHGDDDFVASAAAVTWLKARGFSVGPMQGNAPRAIFRSETGKPLVIGKWRTIPPLAREALHGMITGEHRRGPVEVTIFASAPAEVREAIVAAVPESPGARPGYRPPDITLGAMLAIAAVVVAAHPDTFVPPKKIALRPAVDADWRLRR